MNHKITIRELSDYCIISCSDEQAIQSLVGGNDNIVQAMVDFLLCTPTQFDIETASANSYEEGMEEGYSTGHAEGTEEGYSLGYLDAKEGRPNRYEVRTRKFKEGIA